MANTPTLHFFCGKAGAGKSTVASTLAEDLGAVLISEDIWLLELFGDQIKTFDDYIRVSKKLKAVVGPLTTQLLRSGHTVVLTVRASLSRSCASLLEHPR
jgi:predicted kinase